jgi:hypothetical protein
MDFVREIVSLATFDAPAIVADDVTPLHEPSIELRRAAEQLIAACAPSVALSRF